MWISFTTDIVDIKVSFEHKFYLFSKINDGIYFSVTDILIALILTEGCNELDIRAIGICNY